MQVVGQFDCGRPKTFQVSRSANNLVGSKSDEAFMQAPLACGDSVRTLQIDMIAFDEADRTIRACEVKRGNGQFDAGKIRSIKRDLLCLQVLLKSSGELPKWNPLAAAAPKIIFYYGIRSIPEPWLLVGRALRLSCGL
jgi:hypothetical protein